MRHGTATFSRNADGKTQVEHADDVIGLSLALLDEDGTRLIVDDESGDLLLAGDPTYRYRPIGFAPAGGPARMVVCQRVTEREVGGGRRGGAAGARDRG